MFIQPHIAIDDEGNIVLHIDIDCILQRIYGQVIRIGVIRSVQGIVELQQPFLAAEQHPEYPVLVGLVYRHSVFGQFFLCFILTHMRSPFVRCAG